MNGGIVTFDAAKVREALEMSKAADKRRGSFTQNYSVEYLREDLAPDVLKSLREGADGEGFNFGIKVEEHIDETKIPVGLWLVGDQGIYLMTNGPRPRNEDGSLSAQGLAYAEEADPTTMSNEDCWEAKQALFGGDDGVEFIDEDAVEEALRLSGDKVRIHITPESISLVVPEGGTPTP